MSDLWGTELERKHSEVIRARGEEHGKEGFVLALILGQFLRTSKLRQTEVLGPMAGQRRRGSIDEFQPKDCGKQSAAKGDRDILYEASKVNARGGGFDFQIGIE